MSASYYDPFNPMPVRPRPAPRAPRWPLLVFFASILLVAWYYWPAGWWRPMHDPSAGPRAVQPRGDLAEDEKTTIGIFRAAAPSVVYITTLAERRDAVTLDLSEVPSGTGSGFIWDDAGNIVTNYHVVETAKHWEVTLDDGSTYKARFVGGAPDQDLAVLRIDAPREKLRPIPVGSSADLLVGQKVFAIGNPFGLDQTLTTGVISALNRQIKSRTQRPIKGVIQTDAAINPGNSGGPLLDSAGRLIGVNAAIYSPSGAYAGIGFAIPVDTVNRVVPELLRTGKVARPGLGIHMATDDQARSLGVTGVLIIDVIPNGPAAQAKLRPTRRGPGGWQLGDVIVALDDRPIKKADDLFDQMTKYKVGDVVKVAIQRGGERQVVEIPLDAI